MIQLISQELDAACEEYEETPITLREYLNQVKYKMNVKASEYPFYIFSPQIIGLKTDTYSIRLNEDKIRGVQWNIKY